MQFDATKETSWKESRCRIYMSTGISQEKRIEYFKKKGVWHFTDDGKGAEITVDLALLARAKMSEYNVNGLEDAIVCVS